MGNTRNAIPRRANYPKRKSHYLIKTDKHIEENFIFFTYMTLKWIIILVICEERE